MDSSIQRSTLGSYGYAIKSLAEGLALAKTEGWVSEAEAKREFRAHVRSIQLNKDRDKRVAELRAMADELESEDSDDN